MEFVRQTIEIEGCKPTPATCRTSNTPRPWRKQCRPSCGTDGHRHEDDKLSPDALCAAMFHALARGSAANALARI